VTQSGPGRRKDVETDFGDEARSRCPVCFLVHGHEVELEVDESKRPAVVCPCPACRTVNRQWDTVEEYETWLQTNMPSILKEAEDRQKALAAEQPTAAEAEQDSQHQYQMEDLEDRRKWGLERATEAGTHRTRSAWD